VKVLVAKDYAEFVFNEKVNVLVEYVVSVRYERGLNNRIAKLVMSCMMM